MRKVDIGDFKAFLVRQDDGCFSVRTGDVEEFPGLDGIPRFEVSGYSSILMDGEQD